jgi:hypothetical protein
MPARCAPVAQATATLLLLAGAWSPASASAQERTAPPNADPVVAFSRVLGGSGADAARAVAVDLDANTYITGETSSPDFPATAPPRRAPSAAREFAFVAKLDTAGRVVYATLLGGDRITSGRGIAVDGAGRAYIAGATNATDFPTTRGALQRSYGGGPFDAFAAAFDARGRLRWSTFLGDTHYDEANAIAVDRAGRAVVAGRTVSPQFPRAGRLQPAVAGGAFVAKLDRTGSKLVFSTVFGGADRGNHGNTAFGVAVDRAGRTYATGVTNAAAFPLSRPLQAALAGGGDAFAIKIDAAGRKVAYATYLGGGSDDSGRAIAADAAGNAYVTGVTRSPDFPLRRQLPFATAGADAFVAKLDPSGRALRYATRLGGAGSDDGSAIAVDEAGAAYVSGRASSADFPLTAPHEGAVSTFASAPSAFLARGAAPGGAFVTRLARDGASLGFSTLLGGTATDAGLGLAVDRFGAVAVAGTRGTDAFAEVLAPTPLVQLRRELVPRGRDADVRRLLRLGHADLPFVAPAAGTARVAWFAGETLVAGGRARFATAGPHTIEIKLSRAGRRLLERGPRTELTARGVLAPAGRPGIRSQTTFVLSR